MATKSEVSWHQPVAELMAREGITLREAATRLKVEIGTEACANLFRTKSFQKLLRGERNRFFAEVGLDADWRKKTAVGILLECAKRLMEDGQYDKAAEVILKATKVEGWLEPDTNVNVFAGLSQKDLDALREKIASKAAQIPNAKGIVPSVQ